MSADKMADSKMRSPKMPADNVWQVRQGAPAPGPGQRLIREHMKRPRALLRKLVVGDAIARRPRLGPRGPRSGA